MIFHKMSPRTHHNYFKQNYCNTNTVIMYITDLSFSVVYILDCAGTRRDFALTHYDPVIQGRAPIKIEGSPVL